MNELHVQSISTVLHCTYVFIRKSDNLVYGSRMKTLMMIKFVIISKLSMVFHLHEHFMHFHFLRLSCMEKYNYSVKPISRLSTEQLKAHFS